MIREDIEEYEIEFECMKCGRIYLMCESDIETWKCECDGR